MFSVYIIEDQPHFSNQVKTFLQNFEDPSFEIQTLTQVSDGYKTFYQDYVKSSSAQNIYFIDIYLQDTVNGIELAKAIRQTDFLGYIIFLTSHTCMVGLTFDYHLKAINFIDKKSQNVEEQIGETLKQIINETRNIEGSSLCIKKDNKLINVKCHDIFYIETHHTKRTLIIHTADDYYLYNGTLKSILELLPPSFKRCHKSYILNSNQMTEIDITFQQYQVLFKNNKRCYLSKNYIKNPIKLLKEKAFYHD